ncbi:LacI family DNA-binding transcriptional regulator [Metabacillus sediminilitoris]|uniref:LacI family transcriptional regulator n=1 Tax=Metabacillus sediminilitoris TaxID=2567941 RepID=A0A4S4C1L4_9BACI|nr:LacI family DNA-binding transcriptional regulator [Metabacillus sediminilitoris]QGQ48097.1 substrate-binding domain-containing protein [Metabacillus sediminilitoris]THF81541.1 LacI family transcriptional regulator [Metabacillus sediminilitoris]
MTTIKDIAKAAGVSVTTVSRALNGYSDVNEKTREKIIAVSKQLNYSPNTLARSLVMKKSKTIGLLVSGMTKQSGKDNLLFEVLRGLNQFSAETGYDLVLFSTNSTKQREKTYSQLCRERRVDGAIIQGIKTDDPYLQEVVDSDIPCVLVDIPIESETVGYVTTDNVLGAKKAVNHLLELGHRNIAMVNGHEFAFVSQKRLEGYEQALQEANIPSRTEWVINGAFEEEQAEHQVYQLLKTHPDITAIYCASDLMAIGAMKAVKRLGLCIPNQISIIGYDDILLSSYMTPSLTTIAQNFYEMGFEAGKMLIEILEDKAKSHRKLLETRLIVRESTIKNHT